MGEILVVYVADLLWTCYGEVANLLRTCYEETGVMDFDLSLTAQIFVSCYIKYKVCGKKLECLLLRLCTL